MDSYTQELVDLIFSHVNSFSRTFLNGHTPYESFRYSILKMYKIHKKRLNFSEFGIIKFILMVSTISQWDLVLQLSNTLIIGILRQYIN